MSYFGVFTKLSIGGEIETLTMQKEIDALKKQYEMTHESLNIAIDCLHRLGSSFSHVDEIFKDVRGTFSEIKKL